MVPNGWRILSLGEICNNNLQTGPFGSQLHAHEYVDAGVSVVMPKDLINNRVNLESTAKIPKKRADDLKKHYLKSGDIIFSRRGDVSRFALIDDLSEGAICGTGCLKATPSSNHSSKFLSYFLQRDNVKQWLEQNAVGQTMLNMNTEILSQLPLMTASSVDEEEKIVAILSTWDKAIETTEELICNSQTQKRALMQQLLTGKKRLLDENGERFSGKWEKGNLKAIAKVAKGKALSSKNLLPGVFPVIAGGKSSPYQHAEYTHENIITVSASGAFAGYVAYHNYKIWASDCSTVMGKNRNNTHFIYYVLSLLQNKIYSLQSGGAQPHIYPKDLDSLTISFPINELEQITIATVLSKADREIKLLEKKLEYLKQEKKALMQQLLTGKRRVKANN